MQGAGPTKVSLPRWCHWNTVCIADGLDARKSPHARFELAIELLGAGFVIANLVRIDDDVEDMIWVEAEFYSSRVPDAADEEAGDDQKQQRSGHLRRDQNIADPSNSRQQGILIEPERANRGGRGGSRAAAGVALSAGLRPRARLGLPSGLPVLLPGFPH